MLDYKSYTTDELREALSTINAQQYPERAAELQAELDSRIENAPPSPESEADAQRKLEADRESTRKWRQSIAWLQIIVGPLFALFTLYALSVSAFNVWIALVGIFCVGLGTLSLVAGLKLRANAVAGYELTFISQALQVLVLASPVFSWNYTALGSVMLYFTGSGQFGVQASLNPYFGFSIYGNDPLFIGIDLIPVAVILALLGPGGFRDALAARLEKDNESPASEPSGD